MTHEERMAIYEVVCEAVVKRPGESIVTACSRLSPDDPVVREIMSLDGDPWDRMCRAAAAARATTSARNGEP